MTVAGAAHWDDRYASIGAHSVSWYQDRPTTSLELLADLGAAPEDAVIDVGGGASTFVDHLVDAGYRDVSVLDLSTVALDVEDRIRYVHTLRSALRPGGAFVIGTFAEDGPTECSALPVRRHAPEHLRELLGDVEVIDERREVHQTPSGAEQPFNWIAGRLRS